MSRNTIEVTHLKKVINGKEIISDLTFEVRKGEVLGFLGPNGAGKTTVVRMIMGLTFPSEGTIKIDGKNIQTQFSDAISSIGGIVSSPSCYLYLSGLENLKQKNRLFSNPSSEKKLKEILNTVGLTEAMNENVSTYSLGMKQRLGIALALIGNPKVIILDEPTNGMDPEGVISIRSLIKDLSKNKGITIFMSSHLLSELEQVSDRILIIDKGKKLLLADKESIHAVGGSTKQMIQFKKEQLEMVIDYMRSKKLEYTLIGSTLSTVSNQDDIQGVLKDLLDSGFYIEKYEEEVITLEAAYLKIISEEKEKRG